MLSLASLTESVENSISPLVKNNEISDRAWTQKIKQAVVDFAKDNDNNFCICVSGADISNSDNSEWLYDITIIKMHNEKMIEYVDTIIESEWGDLNDILDDYQKLLQAKAKNKLMICQDDKFTADEIIRVLQDQTSVYSDMSNNETIRVMCWCNSEKIFIKSDLTGAISKTQPQE